jgi:hypothetical protein
MLNYSRPDVGHSRIWSYFSGRGGSLSSTWVKGWPQLRHFTERKIDNVVAIFSFPFRPWLSGSFSKCKNPHHGHATHCVCVVTIFAARFAMLRSPGVRAYLLRLFHRTRKNPR